VKILVLAHKIPYPPTDGGTIATLNMITGISKAGASVDVLSMQTPKHNSGAGNIPVYLTESINWHSVFVDTKINPVKAIFNLLFSKLPYNAERFISKSFAEKLKKLLQSNNYDIVQLEGLYLTPYTNIIKEYSVAKISMRSHNIEHKIWERMAQKESNILKAFYKNILSKRVKKMEHETLSTFDCLVPISPVDANYFEKYYTGYLKVSTTGITDNKFNKNTGQYCNTLFYIGALDWEPNREGLIWFCNEVWPEIINTNPNTTLKIAGRNAPANFPADIANANIQFIGEIENADEYIDANGIMIVPLFSGSGIRIKILEAMARSKCIVTTTIGAEGLGLFHKKNIIIADDAKSMTKEILYLINNCDIVSEIGKEAYKFALMNYNNTNITNDLFEFYKNTLL